jgi:A/G-specific adenine glycosylase
LSLPGIGPYTAAAIRTIAFEQPSVAVDGNIVRVFSRLLCLDSSGESLKKTVRIQASTYLPSSRFGDYTQALMDLGAIVCKPKAPRCLLCPLKSHCKAYISKQTAVYPKLILKRSLPQRFGHFFLLYNPLKKTYFMQQESEKLLRGLWRPCRSPWEDSSQNPKFPIESTWKKCISPLRHTFTHFKLEVNIWYCIISSNDINFEQQGKWLSKEDLKEKGQSTLVKKMWKILAEVPQNSLFL